MSSDQASVTDWVDEPRGESGSEGGSGAGDGLADLSAWNPGGEQVKANQCANCGCHVDPSTARVFAGEDGIPQRCFGCSPAHQMQCGGAAGLETREAREGGFRYRHRGGGRLE